MNTHHFNLLRCYLIGEDGLLVQCAEVLRAQHHRVVGIISPLHLAKTWAMQNNVPYFETLSLAESHLANTPFDYWVSVVNREILPAAVLKRCRCFPINFHYSPLPRLAGVHAPSWAILNGEKQHAVTWHVMAERVDAGDILKQTSFALDENETAFSLHAKCSQHGLDAFSELVDELANQTYPRQPQNLQDRTYYGLHQKPPGNGWITWHDTGENIERLCRALHFRPYTNPFSVAKLSLGEAVFVLESCQIGKLSNQPPGTLVALSDDRWEVATSTHNLILLQISTPEGKPCDFATLAQHYHLVCGQRMPSPTARERKQLQAISTTLGQHEGFWRDQLLAFEAATVPFLPDMPREENPLTHVKRKVQWLPETLTLALTTTYPDTPLSTLLLTAWFVYLYRLGNTDNLGVGFYAPETFKNSVPSALSRFFAHTLPLMIQFQDDLSFADALQHVIQRCHELKTHVTYDQSLWHRDPDLSDKTSYFPLMVSITDESDSVLEPAFVTLLISIDGKRLTWLTDEAALKRDSNFLFITRRFFSHLCTLLQATVETPTTPISQLNWLSPAEKKKLIVTWNQTERDYPQDKTIAQLFEAQVDRTPHHVAVVYGDQQLTYEELNRKANQLGNYLRQQAVKPDEFVTIYLERGLEMIIAILGILKSGAAYLPIATHLPLSRIQFMLLDSRARWVITTQNLARKIKGWCREQAYSIKTLCMDADKSQINACSDQNGQALASPENLAYVIYTSGTTGNPKGVMVCHKNLINLIIEQIKQFKITMKSKVLQFASIGFDASVSEIFTSFFAGSTLYIPLKKNY